MNFYAVVLLATTFSNVASCAYLRKPASSASAPSLTHENASDALGVQGFMKLPLPENCTPPSGFLAEAQRKGANLLSFSESFAIFESEDGPDVSILAYDCNSGRQLMFAHIPKNAGTTIEQLGKRHSINWGLHRVGGKQTMPDGNICSAWHIPPAQLVGYNPYAGPGVEVFCVTRDPWERLVSEYTYDLSMSSLWHYDHIHNGPPCTKQGLNAFLTATFSDMMMGRRWLHDCHMLPQWEFIQGSDGQQWCDHVLPITDLTSSFNALMQKKGLPVRMAPYDKANSKSSYCPALDAESDANLGGLFYPQTKSMVRSIYARDFQHLPDTLP